MTSAPDRPARLPRHRKLLAKAIGTVLVAGPLTAASVIPARSPDEQCAFARMNLVGGSISEQHRARFQRELEHATRAVCEWWGSTFSGQFRIELDDSAGPSMALTPAWRGNRGRMLFRSEAVRSRSTADIHEMVHVFAPNANRFLAEGLAVYAHQHLHGRPAFPNYGSDLNRASKELLGRADLSALDRVATPNRLRVDGRLVEREAYIIAGSFVGFLIEEFGMKKFRKLYMLTPLLTGRIDPGSPQRWARIFAKDLDELSADWMRSLAERR